MALAVAQLAPRILKAERPRRELSSLRRTWLTPMSLATSRRETSGEGLYWGRDSWKTRTSALGVEKGGRGFRFWLINILDDILSSNDYIRYLLARVGISKVEGEM